MRRTKRCRTTGIAPILFFILLPFSNNFLTLERTTGGTDRVTYPSTDRLTFDWSTDRLGKLPMKSFVSRPPILLIIVKTFLGISTLPTNPEYVQIPFHPRWFMVYWL